MSVSGNTYHSPNGNTYIFGGDNSNCTVSTCPVALSVYGYRPSLPFTSVLIALYAICAVIHIAQGVRYKTWGFLSAMLLGCADEIIGYIGRIMLYKNPWNHPGFIIQIVCITIGPVFFSAAIYVLLYQIVRYVSPSHSRFPPRFFYYTFIPCDIVSLILQAVGGAMSSTSNGKSSAGVDIALAGLGFQVATLATFICLAIDFAVRSRSVWSQAKLGTQFKIFAAFLSLATLLILIRCCYRIYELQGGYTRTSTSLRDQATFIGLESVMVILAAFALNVAHPGPVFKERKTLAVAETEAVGGEKVGSGSSSRV